MWRLGCYKYSMKWMAGVPSDGKEKVVWVGRLCEEGDMG